MIQNIEHLRSEPRFRLVEGDVVEPPAIQGAIDRIYHMASPASPIGYVIVGHSERRQLIAPTHLRAVAPASATRNAK